MSDELRRRFQDKIQDRGFHGGRGAAAVGEAELSPDTVRIEALEHGGFAALGSINPRFTPGGPFVRMTLALGRDLLRDGPCRSESAPARIRALCPGLYGHRCDSPGGVTALLASGERPQAALRSAQRARAAFTSTAHLIEHVAIDLLARAAGDAPGNGAVCLHRDRPDRFDIFLECGDPSLGRAVSVLATAAVRDVRARPERLELHARCRDLLAFLTWSNLRLIVPEDIAGLCAWSVPDARAALEALVRLGYLEVIHAPLTFSTVTGLLFRRAGMPPVPSHGAS